MNRRALLVAAAASPVTLALPPARAAEPAGDAAVLTPLHRSEMFALAVYRLAVPRAPVRVRTLVAPFRDHEFKHVAALATALEALGAVRTPAPEDPAALVAEARRLGLDPAWPRRPGAAGTLAYLHDLERALLAAWIAGQARLRDGDLVSLAGEVLTCQAQHLAALRGALDRETLPTAVEPGG